MAQRPDIQQLKDQLGPEFGSLTATQKRKNPWLATSANGLTLAYGTTKENALQNLIVALEARRKSGT